MTMMHSRWAQPLARRGWWSLHAASSLPLAPASPTVDSERLPHRRRARSAEGHVVSANAASAAHPEQPIRCHCNTRLPTRGFHSSPTLCAQTKKTKRGKKASKRGKSKKDKGKQSTQSQNRQPTRRIIAAGSDPTKERHTKEREEVPQAFLAGTASPHAYIARCAVMDEHSGEVYVDPKTLFAEVAGRQLDAKGKRRPLALPRIFRNSHFRYFPPSAFPDHALPLDGAPEVAFLGRSNTGKSSLINALSSLINRSGGGGAARSTASGGGELARTSKRPGRTQTINYFGLVSNDADEHSTLPKSFGRKETSANQSKVYLVDLPGFGYAAAPDQSVDEWQAKTQQFLLSRTSLPDGGGGRRAFGAHAARPPLRRLYLLVDSRLSDPPLLDLSVMGWCDEHAIPYTVVLTKVDGASRANGIKLTNQLCMRYHSLYVEAMQDEEGGEVHMDPVVYWTSAKDKLGMEELLLSVEGNLFSAEDDFEEGEDEEEGDGEGWLNYDDDEEDGVYGQAEEEYDVPSRV